MTSPSGFARVVGSVCMCVCVFKCVWRECTDRIRETAKVCNSSLNLQSIAAVMRHLFIGEGSKVLLRNGKKSAQQMCGEVNMFSFPVGEGKPSTYA